MTLWKVKSHVSLQDGMTITSMVVILQKRRKPQNSQPKMIHLIAHRLADPLANTEMSLNDHFPYTLKCGAKSLVLDRPLIMGVLNITPDSFSDGGKFFADGGAKMDVVLRTAEQMLQDGAAILDVGGESTRPGAAAVSEQQELDRVVPVVEALASQLGAIVSVDTSTPVVMRETAAVGAGIINDVRGLEREGALQAAGDTGLPICLMHMQGTPQTMQKDPNYSDVVDEVIEYLADRIAACEMLGIARERLIIDPGFGFGKTLQHNLHLLADLEHFTHLSVPLLVGLSRKSLLDKITGRSVDERLAGSITLAALAAERGANIIRVHDVKESSDALAVVHALSKVSTAKD